MAEPSVRKPVRMRPHHAWRFSGLAPPGPPPGGPPGPPPPAAGSLAPSAHSPILSVLLESHCGHGHGSSSPYASRREDNNSGWSFTALTFYRLGSSAGLYHPVHHVETHPPTVERLEKKKNRTAGIRRSPGAVPIHQVPHGARVVREQENTRHPPELARPAPLLEEAVNRRHRGRQLRIVDPAPVRELRPRVLRRLTLPHDLPETGSYTTAPIPHLSKHASESTTRCLPF